MFNQSKSVSWVRVRDDHILTVDQITFIADERFHAFHATDNSNSNNAAAQSSATSSALSNQRRQLSTTVGQQQQKASDNNSNSSSANAPWTLQIKFVQARDAGLYECQISAEPKISARVYLHVVGKYTAFRYSKPRVVFFFIFAFQIKFMPFCFSFRARH